MSGILKAIPLSSFGLAKSQAVFRFLSIYLRSAYSSSLFDSMTLPQDTRSALDPGSAGFTYYRLMTTADLATTLAGGVHFSTKGF